MLCLLTTKIIDWKPVGYTNLATQDNAENRDDNSKAPSLQDFLDQQSITYNKDLMYISCYGLVSSLFYIVYVFVSVMIFNYS